MTWACKDEMHEYEICMYKVPTCVTILVHASPPLAPS